MKSALILVLAVVAAVYAAPPQAPPAPPSKLIKIPEKCEDVFSVKVCTKVKAMQNNLNLTAQEAKEAIVDAYKKGKKTYEEIVQSVENFYLEKIKGKTCKDFIAAQKCEKLEKIGKQIAVQAAEFEVFVKKAIAEGKKTSELAYERVLKFYQDKIANKSCYDYFTKYPNFCASLKSTADRLKVKADKYEAAVRKFVLKEIASAKSFEQKVVATLKDYAVNTTCEDLLNPQLCIKLRDYAAKTKVAFPKIMATVRDLLVRGEAIAESFLKAVYKITDAFIDCEDIFTKDSCVRLKNAVTNLQTRVELLRKKIMETAKKTLKKTTEIYHVVVEYTKSHWCKYIKLGCGAADTTIAKRSTPSIPDMWSKYVNVLRQGIAKLKEQLKKSEEKLKKAYNTLDEAVRKALKTAIENGKAKIKAVQEILKKALEAVTGHSNSTTVVKRDVTDVKENFKKAIEQAKELLKQKLQLLIHTSQEELLKLKMSIEALFKKLGVARRSAEDDDDSVDTAAEYIVQAELVEREKEAKDIADAVVEEALATAEDELTDVAFAKTKRDVDGLTKLKNKLKAFGERVKKVLATFKNEQLEAYLKALKESGQKLIGVVEKAYKKLLEEIKKNKGN